jgi:tetratricopeptide (TPR) repeat protein
MSQKLKPTVVTTNARFSKRAKVIALCAVVAVLVLGGGAWWLMSGNDKPEPPKTTEPSTVALNKAIDQYMASKDYKSAINLLKKQSGNNSHTQKLLAAAYANDKDYKNALSTYDVLDKANNLSANDSATAAAVAERAGDYALAVKYYTQAAEKVVAEKTPTYTDQVLMYKAKAKELQKKL